MYTADCVRSVRKLREYLVCLLYTIQLCHWSQKWWWSRAYWNEWNEAQSVAAGFTQVVWPPFLIQSYILQTKRGSLIIGYIRMKCCILSSPYRQESGTMEMVQIARSLSIVRIEEQIRSSLMLLYLGVVSISSHRFIGISTMSDQWKDHLNVNGVYKSLIE